MAIAALAMATSAGIAAEPRPVDTAEAMRARMDRNVDDKISLEEYRNAMVRRFGARDLDADGVLTGDEFPEEWLAGATERQATGKVTWEQFAVELPVVFGHFDTDGDGQLDATETAAFAAARRDEESRP